MDQRRKTAFGQEERTHWASFKIFVKILFKLFIIPKKSVDEH